MEVMYSTITATIKRKIFKDWEKASLRTGTYFEFWAEGQILPYACENWYKKQLTKVAYKTCAVTVSKDDIF